MAGHAAVDFSLAAGQSAGADAHRRKAIRGGVVDARAQVSQRIHQVADGPLPHAWCAIERELAIAQRERRRQRANGGACQAEVQLGVAGIGDQRTVAALHHPGVPIPAHWDAERVKGAAHQLGVFTLQQIDDSGAASG